MNSEELDKLFKERLGKTSPTPSPDLWNRLQQRMEDELPAAQEKKPVMMWARSYAAAAAVSILLTAGVVFYSIQHDADPQSASIAQVESVDKVAEPVKSDNWVNKSNPVASVKAPVSTIPVTPEANIAQAGEVETHLAVEAPVRKSVKQAERKQSASGQTKKAMLAAADTRKVPSQPEPVKVIMPETTVAFASAKTDMNAAPVEIIIKRTVETQTAESLTEDDALSGFDKKRALAKNIFKQVKNLSNGEQVSLSELGVNADRIALETKIGKQKISKVINL